MQCDLLIKNGSVVDGTGRPAFTGNIAVENGRINAVSQDPADGWEAAQVIDAQDLIVCPGFIDIHSHCDFLLPFKERHKDLACLLEQGITTIVGGNCGFSPAPLMKDTKYEDFVQRDFEFLSGRSFDFSWASMHSYFDALERIGFPLNLVQLVGHGTLRKSLWGTDYSLPDQERMQHISRIIEESFADGAYGLSLGLGYEPGMHVKKKELEELARLVKKYNRLLTVHIKTYSRASDAYKSAYLIKPHNLRALEEMIDLAEKTGVKIQISHLMFLGRKSWPSCDRALEMIERAKSRGIDIGFDIFPYYCGNSTVNAVFARWFLKGSEKNFKSFAARTMQSAVWAMGWKMIGFDYGDIQLMKGQQPELEKYNGLFIPEIARKMNCSNSKAVLKISEISRGNALCLFYDINGEKNNDETLVKVMKHPLCTFETDVIIACDGKPNPAGLGCFPAVIQRYHKDKNIFSLEEAVAKMTGKSAERVGLKERGVLKNGYRADITIFDYNLIKDNTTARTAGEKPSGMKYVFVNGHETVREGIAITENKAGHLVRC